jgi:hypothetical protein
MTGQAPNLPVIASPDLSGRGNPLRLRDCFIPIASGFAMTERSDDREKR